ncbi:MAG: cation-translocating P-type ATPase [Trueperaceae bacterium]|nr:cation-translocating P-type ATPase [Trueperaceae bacterium]
MSDPNERREDWHRLNADEVRERLETPEGGLATEEAARRLERDGRNELVETGRKSVWSMILDQFRDFMIIVLIIAAVVAGLIGEATDTIAIAVIVILNAVLGFVQEYRAEQAMAALKKMSAPSATVRRDGRSRSLPAPELVPGDRVSLAAGDVVPADVRLFEAAQLRIDESALTGESAAAEKDASTLDGEELPVGDRLNMAYKGTQVNHGRGDGVVVATGMDTELGRIATLLQEQDDGQTPLQKRLAVFGRRLAFAVLAICALVFVTGLMRGEPPMLMLLTAISLAVAAIPEALPAVVTISLALGARKLVRQQTLVRNLPAVETLGSVTYVCTDKTGTLTLNEMSVQELRAGGRTYQRDEIADADGPIDAETLGEEGEHPVATVLTAMALCNDAQADGSDEATGDPTEVALAELAREKGYLRERLDDTLPRIAELPFDSERKLMTTFHPWVGGKVVSFTKGAIEVLTDRCERMSNGTGTTPLDRSRIEEVSDRIAADGLRTLAFAVRVWDEVPEPLTSDRAETGLVLIGMVGMMDPPRPEAAEAVEECRAAGIRPVMITGDHPRTAEAIARRVGILREEGEAVITGPDLVRMTVDEFEERVEDIRVYARVAPEQKLNIVEALQDRGHFVAMTGDGVNDAPALKRADIGVAMGVTGTDVSKEASDMILLDDNFATIVGAVREGRRIFDNIRKFIKYTMSSNVGEIVTIAVAPFFGLPIPLLPIHILWINLVTDGVPGLALTAEPGERDVMARPPRHPRESIFARGLGIHIVWVGLSMGGVAIATQALFIGAEEGTWRTMVFTVLCLSQMGHVLAIRSERDSLFRQGVLSNRPLLAAVVATFALQMATVYLPFLNPVFDTVPLTAGQLAIALALSTVVFVMVETEKTVKRVRAARTPRSPT